MKVDLLAFGAHPDDIEISAGGTIAKLISEGKKVAVIDLTRGELGTRGTSLDRLNESGNAARILGVSIRENLDIPDGNIFNTEQNRLKIIHSIRKYQPKIILANAPHDRHPDHGKAGELVREASFLAGLKKIQTYEEGDLQDKWRADVLYQYIQYQFIEPHFITDISGFENQKMEAIRAYKSQFFNLDSSEPETVLSNQDFLKGITARDREFGKQIFTSSGEGFLTERLIGVNSLFDII